MLGIHTGISSLVDLECAILQLSKQLLHLLDILLETVRAAATIMPSGKCIANSCFTIVHREPSVQLRDDDLRFKAIVRTDHVAKGLWRVLEVPEHLRTPKDKKQMEEQCIDLTAVLTTILRTLAESNQTIRKKVVVAFSHSHCLD
jgi:hypothetical protein